MSHSFTRRQFARIASISAISFGLAACGGGSDSPTDSANGDLYLAFEKIDQGMSYEQVRDIVGFEYNNGKDDFTSEVHYKWGTGKGTASYAILSVTITKSGVKAKLVGGYKGNNSKFW